MVEKRCVPHTTFWNDFCTCAPVSHHRMPRTRRKLGNVIVLPLAVSKSVLLSQCHRPRMGGGLAPANGSSLRGAGHPLSVTDLRQLDCNGTGRSCVTTSCRRRLTVCGEDRTTSVLSCSTHLLVQYQSGPIHTSCFPVTTSVSCGTRNFLFSGAKST